MGIPFGSPATGVFDPARLLFGSGIDGAITLDGTTTIASPFGAPSSSVYTLTGDCYCTDLTINSGVTLKTGGYMIYVFGTLTLAGTIDRKGNNATTVTTGSSQTGNNLSACADGISGNTANGQSPSGLSTGCLGAAGGAGGAGTGTTSAGGTVSGVTGTIWKGKERAFPSCVNGWWISANTTRRWLGGNGGGGGGGDGTNTGGASGNGGGVMIVNAMFIVQTGSGSFNCNGGNGGNVSGLSGNIGGGGGGGGGGLILNYLTYTGTQPTAASSCAGGSGGAGHGTGTSGSNGSNGTVILNSWA